METLELRPPQFSEDLAWLPCWLQHNQTTPSNEQEIESHYESAIKEFGHGIVNKLEDVNFSSKDGGCNSYRLFLSGQDSLPESIAPSSNNVLHFHLHLSSYGGSECSPTQHLDGSHHLLKYNKVQSISMVEASLDFRENISSQKGINTGEVDLSPQSSNKDIVDNVVCQSLTNTEDHKNRLGEDSDVRYLKDAEVNNAIELSVVASEALVIHDLLKTELDSEALSVEGVLEVSLQVKRARIELLESAHEVLNEEVDLSDSLSDLDDLVMRDAFDDVGLPCSILNNDQCETIGFDVQDTPVKENNSTHGSQCNSIDMRSQQDTLANEFTLKQFEENFAVSGPEGLPLEPEGYNIQNKLSDNVVSASISPNCCKHDGSMLQQSAQNESDEFVVKQKIASSTVNTSSYLIHAKENSSLHDCNTVLAKNDEGVVVLTPNRFKSRWLGGWTGKEVDVSQQLRQNDGKTIPSMFVNETSFLSESADIAPDESSCVQRCESKFQVASQSSVPFGHLDEKGDESLLVSEDVVKCSLSLVDPLCSFVPCSISLDTDSVRQNLNEEKDCRKECSGTFVDVGGSRPSVQRQSASLKTYSMISPTHVAFEGGELGNNYSHQQPCNMRLLSLDPRLDCTRLSCKRNFVETLPSWCTSRAENIDVVDFQTDADQNLEITELKSKTDEVASDGSEFLVQSVKKRITPGSLNQSLQVPKPIMKKSSMKKDHLQSSRPETVSDPQKVRNLMNMQYESTNPLEPCVAVQKRVHFSEANDQLQQNQDLQKVYTTPKNYSALRSGKRWKFSNQCSVSRHRDGKCCLKGRYCKSRKRLIFQGIQFLLTGFSSQKEKDIEGLVWNNGGVVLPDIPCPSSTGKRMSRSNCKGPPVILSPKKLQTTKFLYGCAVNALIVNVSWLTDSIAAGSMLPPMKYTIISNQADYTQVGSPIRHSSRRYIFEKVGVMLHGKQGFCTKLTKVLKHGGGQVFKSLQWLVKSLNKQKISVGVIIVENEYKASRHLKQCALEQGIPMMSARWIINSLHLGELLPLADNNQTTSTVTANILNVPAFREASLEL